ncbi:MAG: 2Fe-2S iron-sulfur cluster-binding protein, partial [Melioribacteraceae bacterium]|nr:2Fe-2S iron-sulfur cluster-binding protein [Melioribacteraceae bacterium]
MIKFTLNGKEAEYKGDPELSLLRYLRDIEGIISPKDGCAPQAACGACTVQLNDKAVLSCIIPMKKVENGTVTTIEGIESNIQEVFINSFVSNGGTQCGFCTPGIVMQSKVLLENNPEPTVEDIKKALHPNLCRCTGYTKIIDSVVNAGELIRSGEKVTYVKPSAKVGKSYPKYDADKLVLGKAHYVDDMKFDNMLYASLKFSDHPRALIKSINIKDAENSSGVIKILTDKDVPGNKRTGLIVDDWPMFRVAGEETRYIGDVLALVI